MLRPRPRHIPIDALLDVILGGRFDDHDGIGLQALEPMPGSHEDTLVLAPLVEALRSGNRTELLRPIVTAVSGRMHHFFLGLQSLHGVPGDPRALVQMVAGLCAGAAE